MTHDDRPDTGQLETGQVGLAALAREVVGLRHDLVDYRETLEARLRYRTRMSAVVALVGLLVVAALAAAGVTVARAESRVARDTLSAALAQTCAEVRELDLVLVTFLNDLTADDPPTGRRGEAIADLIDRLEDDPCPGAPYGEFRVDEGMLDELLDNSSLQEVLP